MYTLPIKCPIFFIDSHMLSFKDLLKQIGIVDIDEL